MYNQTILTRTNAFAQKVYTALLLSILATSAVSYTIPKFFNAAQFFTTHSIYILYVPTIIQVIITAILFRNNALKEMPILAWFVYFIIIGLNSLTIGTLIQFYDSQTIYLALGSAAILFMVMIIQGSIIKKDLSTFTQQITAAIIALIIISALNVFLKSPFMTYVLSWLGVIIFSITSMRDAQEVKRMSLQSTSNINVIYGALSLYLDIINLFIDFLNIFAKNN